MRNCDACGKPIKAGISIGGALLCRDCDVDVRTEIDKRRVAGKPVNAMGIAREMFRETYSAGNYLLRDVPQALWDQAKHRAIDEELSLRDIVLKALADYLSRK